MDRDYLKWLLMSDKGRIGRATYWQATLGIYAILLAAVGWVAAVPQGGVLFIVGVIVLVVVGVVLGLVGRLHVAAKRFHDLDRGNVMILLLIIPYLGFLVEVIWLGCMRGTAGDNRFGPDSAVHEGPDAAPAGVPVATGAGGLFAAPLGALAGSGGVSAAAVPDLSAERPAPVSSGGFPRCAKCQAITLDQTAPCPNCGAELR